MSCSCVTSIIVIFVSVFSFVKSSIISALVFVSRLPVGSSARIIGALFTSALALGGDFLCLQARLSLRRLLPSASSDLLEDHCRA